jgi:sugar lactone lactonase YvrE
MTLKSQQPHKRRRRVGAAAVTAALSATALAASGSAGALAATDGSAGASAATASPVLQTLTYTATGPGGALNRPVGVSAANGTVYVSDTGADVVSTIANGATTAFAGSLSAFGEHGDGGPATSASLYRPGGTAEDAKGDIFIADSGDNTVREVTPDGVIHRFAGTGIAGLGVAGSRSFGFPATLSSLDRPQAVAVNAQGEVFVADAYNNRVVEVTPSGRVSTVAGDGRAGYSGDGRLAAFAELNQPNGVAVDAQGNLYIADSANNVIRRVDAKTGIITTVAGNVAADQANDGLGGFSGDGGPATSAQLNDPQGVAVDGAGDLFIADTFNNAIREVTPDGTITTVVSAASAGGGIPPAGGESNGAAPTASRLNSPYGVAIDQSTDVLYIADTSNSKIAAVTGLAQSGNAAGPTAQAHS